MTRSSRPSPPRTPSSRSPTRARSPRRTCARAAREALTIARDQDIWHLLTDCSGATKVPGAIDILNLVGLVDQVELDKGFRQALIWPDDAETRLGFDFWRTVEANHGLHAKAFGDRDAAIAWLES